MAGLFLPHVLVLVLFVIQCKSSQYNIIFLIFCLLIAFSKGNNPYDSNVSVAFLALIKRYANSEVKKYLNIKCFFLADFVLCAYAYTYI